jgi:hypothetical protein
LAAARIAFQSRFSDRIFFCFEAIFGAHLPPSQYDSARLDAPNAQICGRVLCSNNFGAKQSDLKISW